MASASVAVLNSATARRRVADGAGCKPGIASRRVRRPPRTARHIGRRIASRHRFSTVPAGKRLQLCAGLHTRPPFFGGAPCCLRLHVRFNEKNPKGSEGIESAVGSVACGAGGIGDEESRERTDVEAYAPCGAANGPEISGARDAFRFPIVVRRISAPLIGDAWLGPL
jgi:hypothetical protein